MVPFTEIESKGERRIIFIARTSVIYIIKSELAYINYLAVKQFLFLYYKENYR